MDKNNDKFYQKVAFLSIRKWLILGFKAEKQLRNKKPHRGMGTRLPSS